MPGSLINDVQNTERLKVIIATLTPEELDAAILEKDAEGHTALRQIVYYQNLEILTLVLTRASSAAIEKATLASEGESALHTASWKQKADTYLYLLSKLSDQTVNEAVVKFNVNNANALMLAAKFQESATFMRLLQRLDYATFNQAAVITDSSKSTIDCISKYHFADYVLLTMVYARSRLAVIQRILVGISADPKQALYLALRHQTKADFMLTLQTASFAELNEGLWFEHEGKTTLQDIVDSYGEDALVHLQAKASLATLQKIRELQGLDPHLSIADVLKNAEHFAERLASADNTILSSLMTQSAEDGLTLLEIAAERLSEAALIEFINSLDTDLLNKVIALNGNRVLPKLRRYDTKVTLVDLGTGFENKVMRTILHRASYKIYKDFFGDLALLNAAVNAIDFQEILKLASPEELNSAVQQCNRGEPFLLLARKRKDAKACFTIMLDKVAFAVLNQAFLQLYKDSEVFTYFQTDWLLKTLAVKANYPLLKKIFDHARAKGTDVKFEHPLHYAARYSANFSDFLATVAQDRLMAECGKIDRDTLLLVALKNGNTQLAALAEAADTAVIDKDIQASPLDCLRTLAKYAEPATFQVILAKVSPAVLNECFRYETENEVEPTLHIAASYQTVPNIVSLIQKVGFREFNASALRTGIWGECALMRLLARFACDDASAVVAMAVLYSKANLPATKIILKYRALDEHLALLYAANYHQQTFSLLLHQASQEEINLALTQTLAGQPFLHIVASNSSNTAALQWLFKDLDFAQLSALLLQAYAGTSVLELIAKNHVALLDYLLPRVSLAVMAKILALQGLDPNAALLYALYYKQRNLLAVLRDASPELISAGLNIQAKIVGSSLVVINESRESKILAGERVVNVKPEHRTASAQLLGNVLHVAAAYAQEPEIFLILQNAFKSQDDFDAAMLAKDDIGWTAFHAAAFNQTEPVMFMTLLNMAASRVAINKALTIYANDGISPLYTAASTQSKEAFLVLLAMAEPDVLNASLMQVSSTGFCPVTAILSRYDDETVMAVMNKTNEAVHHRMMIIDGNRILSILAKLGRGAEMQALLQSISPEHWGGALLPQEKYEALKKIIINHDILKDSSLLITLNFMRMHAYLVGKFNVDEADDKLGEKLNTWAQMIAAIMKDPVAEPHDILAGIADVPHYTSTATVGYIEDRFGATKHELTALSKDAAVKFREAWAKYFAYLNMNKPSGYTGSSLTAAVSAILDILNKVDTILSGGVAESAAVPAVATVMYSAAATASADVPGSLSADFDLDNL